MRRIAAFFIILLLLLQSVSFADELPQSDISAESAILIDFNSGEVIWGKDPDKQMYPASTTKMLTAIILLENHDLDEIVTAPMNMPKYSGSNVAIDYGEEFVLEDLMYILLVKSANDAANVLAMYHSGTMEAFALEMNKKAKEIGALNSNFVNPSGLHDAQHYSTAYDLALIAKYAYQNPVFRKMVATESHTVPPTNKQPEERNYVKNGNKFLTGTSADTMAFKGDTIKIKYDIVDGIKTGYTGSAGNCLVTTASKGNARYIVVVLKAGTNNLLYTDSRLLLDHGFDNFQTKTIVSKGAFIKSEPLSDSKLSINLIAGSDLTLTLDKNVHEENIISNMLLDSNLVTPIEAGTRVGVIEYYYNDKKLGEVPLLTEYEITDSNLLKSLEAGFIKRTADNTLDFKYYLGVFFKLLLSFIIYRTIMTTYNLRKRKKRLELKKKTDALEEQS